MSNLMVIDWDLKQVRVLEGTLRGSRLTIENLHEVERPENDAPNKALADALSSVSGSNVRVLGLIGRNQAVLRDLKMPNVPDDELPSMVEFQAIRELSFPVEKAAIDFFRIKQPSSDQNWVVLAALQKDALDHCSDEVANNDLKLDRLGLRPSASWMAFRHSPANTSDATLIIEIIGDAIELTIGQGHAVLFSRATRFRHGAQAGQSLVGEVRRTIAAFANQSPDTTLAKVILATQGKDDLLAALSESLELPVERLDPASIVSFGSDLKNESVNLSDYVASIGAALANHETWPIDFLNPKKAVEKPDRRKPIAVAAAAIVVAVLGVSYFAGHMKLKSGESKIAALMDKSAKLDEILDEGGELLARHEAIEKWSREVNSLQRLKDLTDSFPSTEKVHVTNVTISKDRTGKGQIILSGIATEYLEYNKFLARVKASPLGPAKKTKGVWPFKCEIPFTEELSSLVTIETEQPDADPDEDKVEPGSLSQTNTANQPTSVEKKETGSTPSVN